MSEVPLDGVLDACTLCCDGASEKSRPDMLSSAERWWEGTIEPGLRLVRCSPQHVITQECLSSSDAGVFELESERARLTG